MLAMPYPAFGGVRRPRASAEVISQLRDLMASGRLKPGDRLPPEQELARALSVGRSTVREAIRSLESLELAEARPGAGTFLTAPRATSQHDPLLAILFGDREMQAKLFEVRKVLEPGLAALAARRATGVQCEEMRTALAEQEVRLRHGGCSDPEDGPFHLLVCESTENDILIRILESLIHICRREQEKSHLPAGTSACLLHEEWAVLHAIEARNAFAALHRMQAHLGSLERTIFPAIHSLARQRAAVPSA